MAATPSAQRPFETLKMFNLALAPSDLRDAQELSPLRPNPDTHEPGVLRLRVGKRESVLGGDDGANSQVGMVDYLLNDWLQSNGAVAGEDVLLTWNDERHRSAA